MPGMGDTEAEVHEDVLGIRWQPLQSMEELSPDNEGGDGRPLSHATAMYSTIVPDLSSPQPPSPSTSGPMI